MSCVHCCNLMSLSVALSAANILICAEGHSSVATWRLMYQQLFQLLSVHADGFLCLPLPHWQSEQSVCSYISLLRFLTFHLSCFCSSVSAAITRSFLLSVVWDSFEAGALPPSVFSLSTRLLALAYSHRHTLGILTL